MRKRRLPANLTPGRLLRNVEPSLIDSVSVTGAQVVRRPGQLTINVPRGRAAGRRAGNRWVILETAVLNESVFDDHLLVKWWNPVSQVAYGEAFRILKPLHLQRSRFDGLTFDFDDGSMETYSYLDDDYGTIRSVDYYPDASGYGGESFEEEIKPHFYDGEVFVVAPVGSMTAGSTAGPETGLFSYGLIGVSQITRGTGSFVAAGFQVGMTLTVSGTALNDGTYTIESVAASLMTVSGGSFTSETIASTISGSDEVTAGWIDVNRAGRHFARPDEDLCVVDGKCLYIDEATGCLGFDLDVGSTVVLSGLVVTSGSGISLVAGTPQKLRLTLASRNVTISRTACGVHVGISAVAGTTLTSDLNLDQCT